MAVRSWTTLANVANEDWADMKDTLESMSNAWEAGTLTGIAVSDTPAQERTKRQRILLLLYGTMLAQDQRGNDRTPELDINPELKSMARKIRRMLMREPSFDINPAQS